MSSILELVRIPAVRGDDDDDDDFITLVTLGSAVSAIVVWRRHYLLRTAAEECEASSAGERQSAAKLFRHMETLAQFLCTEGSLTYNSSVISASLLPMALLYLERYLVFSTAAEVRRIEERHLDVMMAALMAVVCSAHMWLEDCRTLRDISIATDISFEMLEQCERIFLCRLGYNLSLADDAVEWINGGGGGGGSRIESNKRKSILIA